MEQPSKFLEILEEKSQFLESSFVKGTEKSELPDAAKGEETPAPEETPEQPEPQEEEQPQQPQTTFTDREQDILNVALKIYRSNPENPIEYKNEFSNMFENSLYEQLLGRLISIADELSD